MAHPGRHPNCLGNERLKFGARRLIHMNLDPPPDFYQIQTATGWGRTLASFAKWCRPKTGWLSLDVGCGPGYLPALLTSYGCQAFGVDIDLQSFQAGRLHPFLVVGDAHNLPFPIRSFHLVTASNLLFLLEDPLWALNEFRRLLLPGGQVALLNPSEYLDVKAAEELAEKKFLSGLDRQSLINWAERAERFWRWNEEDLRELYTRAGMEFLESTLKVGSGLSRFARGKLSEGKDH
jgi:SAM-dependent methyltransferase